MINFYDLIDLNESFSFDEYTKKYIKEITLESFEVSEYLIESGNNNNSSGLIQKIKKFFSKIKEFIKKWWNKLLKFLGLKDGTDEKESKIDITDKADKETEKSKEEVSKKIEEEIEEIEKSKGKKTPLQEIKDERFKKLVEKYSSRDKETFDEIKRHLNGYIENGLPSDEKIYKYESKKYGKCLGISFYNDNKVDEMFDSDEERVEFYKNSILKKYDKIEFMNLDIAKLYKDIRETEEYMNDAHNIIHDIYKIIDLRKTNTREGTLEVLRDIRSKIANRYPDEYVYRAFSKPHDYYINKASSSNIVYIISYLQEISKIRIVKKSAKAENNDLSSYSDTILECFDEINNKIDSNDARLVSTFNDTLSKFSDFEEKRNNTFMTIMSKFAKIETRISDDAIEAIDDLKDDIKNYPDLSDEEKLNILEEVDMSF